MATAGRSSAARDPRVHNTGGGSTIAASAGGYAASLHTIGVRPRSAPRASAAAAAASSAAGLRGWSGHRAASNRSSAAAAASPACSRSAVSRQV